MHCNHMRDLFLCHQHTSYLLTVGPPWMVRGESTVNEYDHHIKHEKNICNLMLFLNHWTNLMGHPSFLSTVDGQTARTSSTEGYDSGVNGLEGDGKSYFLQSCLSTCVHGKGTTRARSCCI